MKSCAVCMDAVAQDPVVRFRALSMRMDLGRPIGVERGWSLADGRE
jgi:hypothetical protein